MSVRRLFASLLYEGQLDDADLLEEIEQSCWASAATAPSKSDSGSISALA
jgi:hypothetical protein